MNYKNLKTNQRVLYRGRSATVLYVESAVTVVIRLDYSDGNVRTIVTQPSKLKPYKSNRIL